ncbi:unnamed protein product [Allacma fusca]|uniref:Salivary secreted peptide n=1 Tax=Allacma fusca TaxID=39272 RepID=A0A8J2K056_9HEXA|nr:unnamed protein product [Allacma fusca]
MKATIIFGIICLVYWVLASQAAEDTKTPKQGGFRNWLKAQLGITATTTTTTTTTTVKPNLLNRVQSIYRKAKDKAKQLLDPKTL